MADIQYIILMIFFIISFILSLSIIIFILLKKYSRLFDQLSLHLAFSDLFTSIPYFLSSKYFESSQLCSYQIYLHQFGMLNKAFIILIIEILVIYIIKTSKLPPLSLQRNGYIICMICIIISFVILITFHTAAIYCHHHEPGHIIEIFHKNQQEFLLYITFYSIIILLCGIGSAIVLLYFYFHITTVWILNESFHRSKLRFLIQRLKWYPIVFITSGIPQLLYVILLLVTDKNILILQLFDYLSTPFLGISLSMIYIYWTLHNFYQQLYQTNHIVQVTSFSNYYDNSQHLLTRTESIPTHPDDYLTNFIISIFTLWRSYTMNSNEPIHEDLLPQQPTPDSNSNISTSNSSSNPPHQHDVSDNLSSPICSIMTQTNSLEYIPPTVQSPVLSNEIQLTSSFSFKNRIQHSSDGSSENRGVPQPQYQPNRISLFDRSFVEQSLHEEFDLGEEDDTRVSRPTDVRQNESISISFLMHLTGGRRQTNSNNMSTF